MTMPWKSKRLWGMAMAAMAVGVGCGAAPGLAPVAADDLFGGGGASAVATRADVSQTPIYETLSRSETYFMTQYYHKRWNPTQRRANNANCGPTSLAMACRAFGRVPADVEDDDPATLIRYVRRVMTGQTDEGTWTYPVQVEDGARKLGLKAKLVFGFQRIKDAMATPGRMVVINVNPSPAYADQLVYPYNGGHFALLTAIDGDRAFVSDPLGKAPIVITLAQLEKALTTPLGHDPDGRYVPPFNGGVLLSQ